MLNIKRLTVTTVKSQESLELTYRKCSYFVSISSDTLVEETTQDTQIQVVCQTSQGQNLPGIGQTLEEY